MLFLTQLFILFLSTAWLDYLVNLIHSVIHSEPLPCSRPCAKQYRCISCLQGAGGQQKGKSKGLLQLQFFPLLQPSKEDQLLNFPLLNKFKVWWNFAGNKCFWVSEALKLGKSILEREAQKRLHRRKIVTKCWSHVILIFVFLFLIICSPPLHLL